MDKTILDLLSLILSGAGIFSLLTQFYVSKPPQLNQTFWDANPFQEKYNIQEDAKKNTDNLFLCLAAIGLLLQSYSIINSDQLPNHQYYNRCYWVFLGAGVFISAVIVIGLSQLGKWLAKRKWMPLMIAKQKEVYSQAKDILDNDGYRSDQISQKDHMNDPEKYRTINLETAKSHITQIEDLLGVKKNSDDLKKRADDLLRFWPDFKKKS